MKATYVERQRRGINPATKKEVVVTQGFEIFKDPVTDDGMKKSAKGLLMVVKGKENLELDDQVSWDEVNSSDNELKTIFKDGEFIKRTTLTEVRNKLDNRSKK